MANVNDIKKSFDALINYPQQGGYTIDKFNTWLYNAHVGLFKQRLGLPEKMEFSTGMPNIAYARTKKIHDDLKPFRKSKNINLSNWDFIPNDKLPQDLLYETSVYYTTIVKKDNSDLINSLKSCGCVPKDSEDIKDEYIKLLGDLDFIEENKWTNRVNSSLIKKAIYCPFYDGWKVYFPVTKADNIRIEYLKKPITPIWGYTIINDAPVYNPLTSVNPEWDDTLISEIVSRMVKEYGLYIDDTSDIQFAENRLNTGS